MYGEQIELKADRPISRFAKNSLRPALLPQEQAVKRLKNSDFRLCLFLDPESFLFDLTMQRA